MAENKVPNSSVEYFYAAKIGDQYLGATGGDWGPRYLPRKNIKEAVLLWSLKRMKSFLIQETNGWADRVTRIVKVKITYKEVGEA